MIRSRSRVVSRCSRWESGSSPDSPGRLIFPPSYKREVPVEVRREEERRRRVCGEEKEEGNMRRRKINRRIKVSFERGKFDQFDESRN